MRIGTIVAAEENPRARQPAYTLEVDFGELGVKTTSAQITENYTAEELKGKQVVAVVNFPVKQIANVFSEVLVLGALSEEQGTVLLEPSLPVENGARIG